MRPYSQIPQLPTTTLRTGEEGPGPTTAYAGEETSTVSYAADDDVNAFGEF